MLVQNLFGHFLLEFAEELAKREGYRRKMRLCRKIPFHKKIFKGMIGVMPKEVADLMAAKFNSAGVEMGIIEKKFIKFVEKEKKNKKQMELRNIKN